MTSSPFDLKNAAASLLDRLALGALAFALCAGYFFFLWENGVLSLIAGGALFALVALSSLLLERRTLALRERMLRERVGGAIALGELLLMPSKAACQSARDLLCLALDARPLDQDQMLEGGERWLVRCAQCLQGSAASEGDVLSAHRARIESSCDRCVLVTTQRFTPEAVRAAEWMDPPVRLIAGRQLAALYGRMHPATDEEIARHAARQKKPFAWRRIRALALSPVKLKRYMLCGLLLLCCYCISGSRAALLSALLAFILSLLCARENRRRFRL